MTPSASPARDPEAAPGERRAVAARGAYRLFDGEVDRLLGARRSADGPRLVVTPNLDHLRLLSRSRALRRAYDAADLIVNDSRLLQRLVLGRGARCLPGSEFSPQILAAAPAGARVLVIGATPAVECWALRAHPALAFRFLEPTRGYVRRRSERRALVAAARAFAPAHVLVCTGAPQSELLGAQLKRGLSHPCDIVCCGSALQFLAGDKRRAPAWMRGAGAEWAWRFLREPHTRRRYLADAAFLALRLPALWRLRGSAQARLPGFSLSTSRRERP